MIENNVPEISVILPVYNSGEYLEECIDSILNQTFGNFELIIVYDKSNDNSKEIIEKYLKVDKRIIFIENEKKSGHPAAINKGLGIARGRYIAKMDSDDISMPNRLEREYLFLENNKDYFLIGSNAIRIDENGKYLEAIKFKKDIDIENFEKFTPFIHTSIMFRNTKTRYREKFRLSEDTDFYLRALSMGLKIGNIDETLVKYRMRTTNICMTNWPRGQIFRDIALKFYYQRIENGTDQYDKLNEEDVMSVPTGDSMNNYLKAMIGFSLKNRNMEDAKKYFEEYSKKIDFKTRIIYTILFVFPSLYYIRFRIKSFVRRHSKDKSRVY